MLYNFHQTFGMLKKDVSMTIRCQKNSAPDDKSVGLSNFFSKNRSLGKFSNLFYSELIVVYSGDESVVLIRSLTKQIWSILHPIHSSINWSDWSPFFVKIPAFFTFPPLRSCALLRGLLVLREQTAGLPLAHFVPHRDVRLQHLHSANEKKEARKINFQSEAYTGYRLGAGCYNNPLETRKIFRGSGKNGEEKI